MTDDTNSRPSYSDAQFQDLIPDGDGVYVSSLTIRRELGCTLQTVNRRVADLARDDEIDLYDIEAGELQTTSSNAGKSRICSSPITIMPSVPSASPMTTSNATRSEATRVSLGAISGSVHGMDSCRRITSALRVIGHKSKCLRRLKPSTYTTRGVQVSIRHFPLNHRTRTRTYARD